MKYLRYYHEFYDIEQNLYRVEILQEAETPYVPQWVELASDPLQIEWGEVSKLDPVMSSSATLRLISMTDRQFADLYTVAVGVIRMDVYRNGTPYWSGTLDAELFEEPYSQLNRYVTECTFSDFAVLNRFSWTQKGVATLQEIIETCLTASDVNYSSIVTHISTQIADTSGDILSGCVLALDNFYDEDGEAWPIRDVLDEVLRPFALRLKQKNGQIIISDINSVSQLDTKEVEWRGADAMLGVEPTYNKVVITFSPYSEPTIFDGTFEEDKILQNVGSPGVQQIGVDVPGTDFTGFFIYKGAELNGLVEVQKMLVGNGASLYRIKPDVDGSASAGVLWGIRPFNDEWIGNRPIPMRNDVWANDIIIQTPRIPITQGIADYRLKISLDVLFDPRRNPFEEANDDNEGKNWKRFKELANFGGIPIEVTLYGYDGKTYKCDYVNGRDRIATWHEAVEDGRSRMTLMYYNEGDRRSDTGFGGWQTNKQHITYSGKDLPKEITFSIEGEKISLPPVAGALEVAVYAGIIVGDNVDSDIATDDRAEDVVNIARWLLYKDLKVTVANRNGKDFDPEDIVVSAWINKAAEEELSVDTYVGSITNRLPLAKGAIMAQGDYRPIAKFKRAGVTDYIERLLAGTIYSNYAGRMSTLTGTIRLIPGEEILSDNSAVNSRYLILSEVQNVAEATSEVKMAEITADEYESMEYETV